MIVPELSEDPGSIVLELEVVSSGWRQFVADDIERELVTSSKVFVRDRSLDLGLTSRYLTVSLNLLSIRLRAYTYTDTSQHVIHQDIVDVILANEISDQHLGILSTLSFGLASCSGSDSRCLKRILSVCLFLSPFQPFASNLLRVREDVGIEGGTFDTGYICLLLAWDRYGRESRLRMY